jgi:hypothetical protein
VINFAVEFIILLKGEVIRVAKKKLLPVGIILVIAIVLLVIKFIGAGESTSATADGMKLENVLGDDPSSVILYGFDEQKYDITDEQDIDTLIDSLRSATYTEIDQQDYKVGFYLMDIIYGSETVSLGIGEDCVSYEGVQYETEQNSLDEINNIIAKYLGEDNII